VTPAEETTPEPAALLLLRRRLTEAAVAAAAAGQEELASALDTAAFDALDALTAIVDAFVESDWETVTCLT
jgi:hypothetical protein